MGKHAEWRDLHGDKTGTDLAINRASGKAALWMLVAFVVLLIALPITVGTLNGWKSAEPVSRPTPTPTATAAAKPHTPQGTWLATPLQSGGTITPPRSVGRSDVVVRTTSVPDPMPVLGFMLAGVLVIALFAGGVFLVKRTHRNLAVARAAEKERGRVLEAAKTRLNRTLIRQASYELDLGKLLSFPLMNNYEEPVVRQYVSSMRKAEELQRMMAGSTPSSAAQSAFVQAVEAFEFDFETAERKAESVRWSRFNEGERKRLRDAQTALAIVLDESYLPEQRQAQYKRIVSLLEGLIHVPQPALLELTTRARLHELTAS